jgi:hypothetical protein
LRIDSEIIRVGRTNHQLDSPWGKNVRWCAGCVAASVLRTWFVVVGPRICGYEADDE